MVWSAVVLNIWVCFTVVACIFTLWDIICWYLLPRFQVLGSGFEVISVGKKKLVRSVPTELNKDHNEILELAQVSIHVSSTYLHLEYFLSSETCKFYVPHLSNTSLSMFYMLKVGMAALWISLHSWRFSSWYGFSMNLALVYVLFSVSILDFPVFQNHVGFVYASQWLSLGDPLEFLFFFSLLFAATIMQSLLFQINCVSRCITFHFQHTKLQLWVKLAYLAYH